MGTQADYKYAQDFRDVVKKIATRVVHKEVPSVKLGKVYSVDAGRQIAWILFPGETIDNLVKVRCASDKIPAQTMSTSFADQGYDAPADIVRVWGKPGNFFVLDFYSGTPVATFRQVAGSVYITPEQFGAVGEGGVDDSYALQLAFSTAGAQTVGVVVYLSKQYYWKGDLLHPGGVIVHGTGVAKYTVPDRIEGNLVALDSTARYRYGQWGGGSSANDNPGSLYDLTIDGNYVANEVFRAECVDGYVSNCHFIRAASGGKCAEIGGSQNSTFQKVHFGYVENGRALSFDVGVDGGQSAGMIRFNDCYFATSGTLLYGSTDPLHFPPHEIIFTNCLFEDRGANNRLIDLRAGEWQFRACIITNSDALTKPDNDCLIHVTNAVKTDWGTQVTLDSCYYNGGSSVPKPTDIIRVGTAGSVTNEVRVYGSSRVYNADYFICFDGTNALTSILGSVYRGVGVSWYRAINGGNTFNVRHDSPTPWRFVMPVADGVLPVPIAVRVEGDAQNRWWIEANGKVIWGDGALTTVRGSIEYNPANGGFMAVGRRWRWENAWGLRYLATFITTVNQAVTVSAVDTAAPGSSLVFQADNASAVVTLEGGYDGQHFEFILSNPGFTGNTVTWPSNIKFFGTVPQPDSSVGGVIVTLRKFGTDWFGGALGGSGGGGGIGGATIRSVTSDTAAATAAKEATLAGYTPATGDVLMVTLTNGNTVASPTLNINAGGAKDIWLAGFQMTAATATVLAGGLWALRYDGTRWHMLGSPVNYTAATQAEMEAGALSTVRWMSPLNVRQAINSGFDEKVDDRVSALLQQGSGITLLYDDAANTLTIGTPTRRYEENCPAVAAGGTWTVTHNLNSQDVIAMVRRVAAPYDYVDVYIEATTVNTLSIKPDAALTAGQFRVLVKL